MSGMSKWWWYWQWTKLITHSVVTFGCGAVAFIWMLKGDYGRATFNLLLAFINGFWFEQQLKSIRERIR